MNLTSPSQVKAWCIENGFHPNKVLGQNFLIDRNALVAIVDAGLANGEAPSAGNAKPNGEAPSLGNAKPNGEAPSAGNAKPNGEATFQSLLDKGNNREKRDGNPNTSRKARILEIGPGLGVLTEELLARGCEVVAIEKDPVLAARLAKEARPHLTVVTGDALEYASRVSCLASQLASRDTGLASSTADGEGVRPEVRDRCGDEKRETREFDAMISNLPYQAGTRILLDLVRAREIPAMTVLVQTEVAERLAAREGAKTRSLAGVWAQLDYDVKIVRKVAASCFWPRPEIGSSVVRLTRHDRNASLTPEERKLFHRLTKQAFEHRRKQLGSIFKDMIQSTARAEELSNTDWINLVKGLTEMNKTPEEFLKENGLAPAAEIDRAKLLATFLSEMEKGLKGEKSSLPMIPAYVGVNGKIPQGAKAAVLDAGGTNFRSAIVSIPPTIEDKRNQPMPGAREPVDEEDFYRAFADELKRVAPKATVKKYGWCFSYNCDATPDLDAKLNCWTKGIQAPAIVGQYVGAELLKRLGGGEIAIVNDTVATLLAAKAMEGDRTYSSYIGFILGTGTNTAYVEKNRNIEKVSGLDPEGSMIINAEAGSFDKAPRSAFDLAMDAKQIDPGHNTFEKMIAGGYLGLVGLEVYKAAAKAGYFTKPAADRIASLATLETLDFDNFCAGIRREGRSNPLDAAFADPNDAKMARRLGLPVFERAAVLTAVQLAAFCIKSGEGADPARPIAICADGSTFYKTCAIALEKVGRRELDEMLGKRHIHYELMPQIDDAPMVGAAIAAML